MVGGTVIENILSTCQESGRHRRRLLCVDRRNSDECAVFADAEDAADVAPGDRIWWQGRSIYWTRDGVFTERAIRKVGFSFDPRNTD